MTGCAGYPLGRAANEFRDEDIGERAVFLGSVAVATLPCGFNFAALGLSDFWGLWRF